MLHALRSHFVLSRVQEDLGWFLSEEVLTPRQGRAVSETLRELCRDVAPHALKLCDAFGIPDHMLHSPITGDWVEYNAFDNKGELLESARGWDKVAPKRKRSKAAPKKKAVKKVVNKAAS